MGNAKKAGRAKKRRFCGNRFTSSRTVDSENELQPIIDSPTTEEVSCSSAKKIKLNNEYVAGNQSVGSPDGFILMNLTLLFEFLTSNIICDECKQHSVPCDLNDVAKNGFAHEIIMKCTNCMNWEARLQNSRSGSANNHKEVNVRMISFVRSIGRGHSALQNFSLYLNSPPPMTYPNYLKIFRRIHAVSHDVATESMQAAASEIKESSRQETIDHLNRTNIQAECAVSVDGTWQRRGHASHHGVVTAISVDTGKCVDSEVLSNICKGCRHWEHKKGTDDYDQWRLTHNCRINHSGSAGAMEAVGALNIFKRSKETRQLVYTQYLGDGDSASYKKVVEAKPYPGKEVEKLECVGHVQKRCGTRLRRLISDNKGRKLEDGRGLGGIGRLTSKKIDTLQNYYGFAIRQNAGNLKQMVADIKAVPYHVASSAKHPKHDFCPTNSWCKFKIDPDNYKHKNGLPEAVLKFIEPVFKDLSDENLLRKCLHGKTQNNNECLNKMIWDRCSKEIYVEKEVIEQAVYTAVAYFNDGASSILKFFEKLGLSGRHTALACIAKDVKRIAQSKRKSTELAKKRRKTIRAIRKGYQDAAEAREGDMYTPGGH